MLFMAVFANRCKMYHIVLLIRLGIFRSGGFFCFFFYKAKYTCRASEVLHPLAQDRHLWESFSSYTDLILTGQPVMVVDCGAHYT